MSCLCVQPQTAGHAATLKQGHTTQKFHFTVKLTLCTPSPCAHPRRPFSRHDGCSYRHAVWLKAHHARLFVSWMCAMREECASVIGLCACPVCVSGLSGICQWGAGWLAIASENKRHAKLPCQVQNIALLPLLPLRSRLRQACSKLCRCSARACRTPSRPSLMLLRMGQGYSMKPSELIQCFSLLCGGSIDMHAVHRYAILPELSHTCQGHHRCGCACAQIAHAPRAPPSACLVWKPPEGP